jgi:D-sedoheptulose 7-phosphate isomerase
MDTVFHTYVHSYVEDLKRTLDEFDRDVLQKVFDLLVQARRDDRHIFLFGNGGSAAAASHMACDLGKGTVDFAAPDAPDFRRFRVTSLADNVALLTALGNDISFNEVFVEPLRAHLRPGDIVIAISASGNSPNLIAALEFARTNGATTVGFLGFGGGKARELVDVALVVSSRNYGIAEDFHLIAQHILTQCLKRVLAAAAARPMLFLDRDGILNERAAPHQYVTRWEDFRFIPGIVGTLRQAQALGYGLVVLTNQQCVGKGLLTAGDLAGIHTAMVKELAVQGVTIDGVYTCPHLEGDRCGCRKPQPGLIYRALNETNYIVDVPGSFLLGDSETDVLAGRAAGLQSILLAPANTPRPASAAAHTIAAASDLVPILASARPAIS